MAFARMTELFFWWVCLKIRRRQINKMNSIMETLLTNITNMIGYFSNVSIVGKHN